jgi:hypothetical protein
VSPLSGIAPLLQIGFGTAAQDLDVYGSNGTDLGSISASVNTANLFALIDSTQLTVSEVGPATGLIDSQAADLPNMGTVYSVTDFGGGWENVYEAVPNADGSAAGSITDYLVTPLGNLDLSTMLDAIAQLDPGDAPAGVSTGGQRLRPLRPEHLVLIWRRTSGR